MKFRYQNGTHPFIGLHVQIQAVKSFLLLNETLAMLIGDQTHEYQMLNAFYEISLVPQHDYIPD